jgi:hypothetical protein
MENIEILPSQPKEDPIAVNLLHGLSALNPK